MVYGKHMLKKLALLVVISDLMVSTVDAQAIKSEEILINSNDQEYQSYLAIPVSNMPKPAIILLHSFKGMKQGYRDLVDQMAEAGFVTLALGWQTFEQEPSDKTVKNLVKDGLKYLTERRDVNMNAIGLTGFCAGGRYTMLLLPQIKEFKAGVAWYGFPNQGGTEQKPKPPSEFINELERPLLILHGSKDRPSPINTIYEYANKLDTADKIFKLSVYQGEPHSYVLNDGQLSSSFASRDSQREMLAYFREWLQ